MSPPMQAALLISIQPYNHQKWLSVAIGPELLKQVITDLKNWLPEAFKSVVGNPDKDYYLHVSKIYPGNRVNL